MTIPPRAYAVPQNDPNYSPPPLTFDPWPTTVVIGDKGGALIIKDGQITVGEGWEPSAAAAEVIRCINAACGPVLAISPAADRHIRGAMNDGFKLGVACAASIARATATAAPASAATLLALAEVLDEAKANPLLDGAAP